MKRGKDTAGTLTVENHNGTLSITGRDNVDRARVLILKHALHLEMLGLGRRGHTVFSIVKREFGFKGNRQKVYDQLCQFIDNNILPPR